MAVEMERAYLDKRARGRKGIWKSVTITVVFKCPHPGATDRAAFTTTI